VAIGEFGREDAPFSGDERGMETSFEVVEDDEGSASCASSEIGGGTDIDCVNGGGGENCFESVGATDFTNFAAADDTFFLCLLPVSVFDVILMDAMVEGGIEAVSVEALFAVFFTFVSVLSFFSFTFVSILS
jgi:hypothetical protein